jgi:hypothetical protein
MFGVRHDSSCFSTCLFVGTFVTGKSHNQNQ